ncbi:MAG: DUF6273 domain-containing protein [Eubacteriales bacterium]|nr:DUF6273 domain-containing protein [Eubacteriales bacterium]
MIQQSLVTMKNLTKRFLAMTLTVILAVTMLPGSLLETMGMKTEAQAETTLRNPRIVEDSSMKAGQKVTWDCVWFGEYPQTEIVDTPERSGCYGRNWNDGNQYEVNPSLYTALKNATWSSNNIAKIGNERYQKVSKGDGFFPSSDLAREYYNWSSSTEEHYFRYEPIKWRVLNISNGNILLFADKALENESYDGANLSGITWEKSRVRSWLNGYNETMNSKGVDFTVINQNFINKAFSSEEILAINNTHVINDNNITYGTNGGNNTIDKIFLLSESEIYGTDQANSYGFSKKSGVNDEARRMKSSCYAKAVGVRNNTTTEYLGNCVWLSRSPGKEATNAITIYMYGEAISYYNIGQYFAICPALNLNSLYTDVYSYAGTVCSDGTMNEVAAPGGGNTDPEDKGFTISSINLPSTQTIEKCNETATITADVTVEVDSEEVLGTNIENRIASSLNVTSSDFSIVEISSVSGSGSLLGNQYKVSIRLNIKDSGTTKITASADGKSAECNVTVHDVEIQNLKQSIFNNPKINVEWDVAQNADGYFVQYAKNADALTESNEKYDVTDTKYVSENMEYGETYYVRVSAYKTVDGEKKHYSWSEPISVKILDVWSFANSETDLRNNAQYISLKDFNTLTKNLSTEEQDLIKYSLGEDGTQKYNLNLEGALPADRMVGCGGICYGFVAWAALINANIHKPSDIQENAKTLYQLTNADNNVSAINFYYIQEKLSNFSNAAQSFSNISLDEQLKQLDIQARGCQNGGSPVSICFSWLDNNGYNEDGTVIDNIEGHWCSHQIMVYGAETGYWPIEAINVNKEAIVSANSGTVFTKKYLVYNPNYPGDTSGLYDIYVTDDDSKWCIPGLGFICTNALGEIEEDDIKCDKNNCFLNLVTNDLSLLNQVDYVTGDISTKDYTNYRGTQLEVLADNTYHIESDSGSADINGLTIDNSSYQGNVVVVPNAGSFDNRVYYSNVYIPTSEKLKITSSKSLSLRLIGSESLLTICNDKKGTVSFTEDNQIIIDTEAGDKGLVRFAEANEHVIAGADAIEIDYNNIDNLTYDYGRNIISGDNLDSLDVTVIVNEQEKTLPVSTDKNAVQIKCNDEGVIASIDSDNNGTFDQVIATATIESHTHSWNSGTITKAATCTTKGIKTYRCSCGVTKTEEIPAIGHKWDAGVITKEPTTTSTGVMTYTCNKCGDKKTESIPKKTSTTISLCNPRVLSESQMTIKLKTTWDCIWFGSYPQTEIVDHESASGVYGKKWANVNDYEVDENLYNVLQNASYDMNGDTIIASQKYRRLQKSDVTLSTNGNGFYYNWPDSDTYHYFRYEPIKWRVLNISGEKALLLADITLDCQKYYPDLSSTTWETSTIRSWLNGYGNESNAYGVDYSNKNFIDFAFSINEKSAIFNSEVVDDTNVAGEKKTIDKVFLFSEKEVSNSDVTQKYGFPNNRASNLNRSSKSSTYAKAMGIYSGTYSNELGNCEWLLRSKTDDKFYIKCVNQYGAINDFNKVTYAGCGVRPALNINLSTNLYSFAGTVCSDGTVDEHAISGSGSHDHIFDVGTITTKPTTSSTGVKTYTCKICGQTKTEVVAKLPTSSTLTPVANVITATDITRIYSTGTQSFNIGASCLGGAKLTYTSNNSNIPVNSAGQVTVKAKYMGEATITIASSATEKYKSTMKQITVTVTPKKTTISKATSPKKMTMKVTWKKNVTASGYQIYVSTSKTFASNKVLTIKGQKKVSATVKKLKSKKKYYTKVRAYRAVSGKKIYGPWSAVKACKVK